MNLSGFWGFFIAVLVVLAQFELGDAETCNCNGGNFITWNDLKVDYRKLSMGEFGVRNRVIVVNKNGTGDSVTVQGAIDMVPENNQQRVKIHILPGFYSEKVHIPANKPFISFIGEEDRANDTVITWHDKAGDSVPYGGVLGTWNSSSVIVESDYFCASWITFENTVIAQPGGVGGYQAVALRIAGEKAVFYKVRFLGSQDTLLDEKGSHYFFQCFIQGTTDFIFGNARSLYQDCAISIVGDGFAIAAHHRNSDAEETGFSFVNCTISGTGSVYLGRAWGDYARVIYSYSVFDIDVRPGGWQDWRIPARQKTAVFGEYECRGRGANRSTRAEWTKALSYSEARNFMDTAFISGVQWLKL